MAESQQPTGSTEDGTTTSESPSTPGAGSQQEGHGPLMRGRGLAAASAIAIGLIAAVLIVSINGNDDDPADGSDAVDIAAGDTVPAESAADVPEVSTEGPFEVLLEPSTDGLLHLTVADPATPAVADAPSQHCVLVTLDGPATVEAFGCTEAGTDGAGEVVLSSPGEPLVGCAAVTVRGPDGEVSATDASSEFNVIEGAALPQGEYDVTVVAVTGVGDGCPPIDDGGVERETTARSSMVID